jgi:hypothetical protein
MFDIKNLSLMMTLRASILLESLTFVKDREITFKICEQKIILRFWPF